MNNWMAGARSAIVHPGRCSRRRGIVCWVTEDGCMIPPSSQGSYTNQIQGNDIGTDASGTFTDLDGQPESGDELGMPAAALLSGGLYFLFRQLMS